MKIRSVFHHGPTPNKDREIRDSSIDIQVKIKSEGGENKISLKFGE